jgi:hypothetical protein
MFVVMHRVLTGYLWIERRWFTAIQPLLLLLLWLLGVMLMIGWGLALLEVPHQVAR